MPTAFSVENEMHEPPPNGSPHGLATLVDLLLAEQRQLTPVEAFSRAHDAGQVRARQYHKLLPVQPPRTGQQYAFEVDLDKCSGCKACVTACHSLNGLDEGETWRSVGTLVSNDWHIPLQQTVTTACHHCVDPGCLNGCPVLAYDKDPVTGIVRHLDDQCIGCQYCVMKCPYEVPQYSSRRGIVRKCDMCANRLAVGEAPACVQACPNEAIKITVIEQAKVRAKYRALPELNLIAQRESRKGGMGETENTCNTSFPLSLLPTFSLANRFLPDSPNPAITLPTTRYVSLRPLTAALEAGDAHHIPRGHAHVPLSFMLVFTQLGVGLAAFDAAFGGKSRVPSIVALVATLIGVGLGTLHLGEPLKAWRGFLGWRKSWLSRELIAFGAFINALAAHVLLQTALTAAGTVLAGVVAVGCSAMLYVDTRRPFWSGPLTFGKFLGTTWLLGAAGGFTITAMGYTTAPLSPPALLVSVAAVFKFGVEQRVMRKGTDLEGSPLDALKRSAWLLAGPLGFQVRLRALFLVCGFALPIGWFSSGRALVPALMFGFCLVGELMERHLFFIAEAAPKMPGGGPA